jgi:hypothetical protein
MKKDITLEDLVNSNVTKTPDAELSTQVEDIKNETTTVIGNADAIRSAKPITTSELGKSLKEKNPEAKKKAEETDAPVVANAFKAMEDTLAERRRRIDEEVMPIVMENAREMAMEKELGELANNEDNESGDTIDDDFSDLDDEAEVSKKVDDGVYVAPSIEMPEEEHAIETKVTPVPKKVKEKTEESDTNSLDDLMKDLGLDGEEEEVVDTEEETAEELRERFKTSLSGVKITRNEIDLTKFQIAKEPVSSAMALNAIGNNTKKRCDHPLLHSKRNMTFEECSGPELDSLRKTINNSNGINGVIASLRFIYNHNIDANKKSFEAWCKSIRTEDIESLYFGMYKACYGDTNLVARADVDKKGCGKTSLIDTPINDMIKFKDDDAKKLYDNLMAQDTTNPGSKIKSQTLVVSDDIVVSYSDPTLYSTFIQYASIKPEITEKYSDQLNTMAYIDGFFRIDHANMQLIPIAIKEYPNNINKTVMSKLKTYVDILKTLTNDQYNVMVSKLENIVGENKISYIYPEAKCPECDNDIPEEPIESMLNLLFTRAQLVQVKSL